MLPGRNPYYVGEIRRGIQDAQAQLADYSVELMTEQCSNVSYPEEVLEKIDSLIEKGAKGIAICAMDCDPVAKKINKLSEQGIPVVTFDSDIRSSRLLFYGKDITKSGRVAGALMAKYVSPDQRVIVGIGNREFPEHISRVNGFIETMKNAGFADNSLELIETFNDYVVTHRKISQLLKSSRDFGGIYMANHSLTGCMDGVRSAACRVPPVVIYSEMNERVARYLMSGELDFCVTPNAYMMGYRPLILLKEYLIDHREPGTDKMLTDIQIIGKENID